MRILIVSDTSSYMRGGVPAETRALIQGLIRNRHTVGLLADVPLSGAEAAIHFPMRPPLGAHLESELPAAIASFKPDFVHVVSINSRAHARLPASLVGQRWAVTVHSVSPYERKLNGWHANERVHYGLRWLRFLPNTLVWRWALSTTSAPTIVVHSRFVEEILRRYGCATKSLLLIPLPFEAPPVSQGSGDLSARAPDMRIVTVGGIAHTKGQHDVVKALARMLSAHPKATAQFIGEIRDPGYIDFLKSLADRLGVSDRIRITPDLDDAGKEAALENATVYVQPSHEEGFCLAYAEAAAIVPRLVGTDTGAIAAISAGDPGARVVAARDPAALADAIIDVARAALPQDHLKQRAKRMTNRYSTDAYIAAHERLYRGAGR